MRVSTGQANTVMGLTRIIPVTSGAISRHVNILVERGFLRRRYNLRNRRSYTVALTAQGNELVEAMMPLATAANESLFAGISGEDRRVFLEVIQGIIRNAG